MRIVDCKLIFQFSKKNLPSYFTISIIKIFKSTPKYILIASSQSKYKQIKKELVGDSS